MPDTAFPSPTPLVGVARILSLPAAKHRGHVDAGAITAERARYALSPRDRFASCSQNPWVRSLSPPPPSAARPGFGSLDAVVTSMCIHRSPDHHERGLFAKIIARLAPSGWYVNDDSVTAADPVDEAAWGRTNDRIDPQAASKRDSRTAVEQANFENHVRRMVALARQLEYLHLACSEGIEAHWKQLEDVIQPEPLVSSDESASEPHGLAPPLDSWGFTIAANSEICTSFMNCSTSFSVAGLRRAPGPRSVNAGYGSAYDDIQQSRARVSDRAGNDLPGGSHFSGRATYSER